MRLEDEYDDEMGFIPAEFDLNEVDVEEIHYCEFETRSFAATFHRGACYE